MKPTPDPFPDLDKTLDDVDSYRMPLLEHLRELRKRMIIALAFTLACCFGAFYFADPIWNVLVAPMNDALQSTGKGSMAITEPLEGFITYMKVAGLAGVAAASPVIFYQTWRFVAPGLYTKEKRFFLPLVAMSSLLFLAGVAFGYFVIFRYAFPFFLEITADDVQAVLSINSYLGVVTKLLLAFGITFQLPVVVFFLSRAGLVNAHDMIAFFKYSVVGMFVIAAMLTPPDVMSQLLMVGPLMVLYGIGIVVSWLSSTKPVATP